MSIRQNSHLVPDPAESPFIGRVSGYLRCSLSLKNRLPQRVFCSSTRRIKEKALQTAPPQTWKAGSAPESRKKSAKAFPPKGLPLGRCVGVDFHHMVGIE